MASRKTPRLAFGEYVQSDDGGSRFWMARLQLMEAVERLYPKMLQKLSDDVFPAYEECSKLGFNFDDTLWNDCISPHMQIPDQLKTALTVWARAHNADVGWFLDDACRTLRGWHIAPDWRKSLRWNSIGPTHSTLAVAERFELDYQGWEMLSFTWPDYSKGLRKRFERKLAEYEAASRKLAESQGLVLTQRKYSPSNLDWFALYQFADVSSTTIVRQYSTQAPNIDESVVLKGIKAAAKLIKWDSLRPASKRSRRKIR